MSAPTGPFAEQAKLRAAIAAISAEIASLPAEIRGEDGVTHKTDLPERWTALVELLGLGDAPELRTCPSCQASIMRAATRCRECWRKVDPLPSPRR